MNDGNAKTSGGNHAVIDTDKGEIPTTIGADGNMSRPLSPPLIRKVTIRP